MATRSVLSEEEILKNSEMFQKLCNSFKAPERKDKINTFLGLYEEKIYTAPASTRAEYHGAYIGGLIHHTLAVTKNLMEISKLWGPELERDSLLLVGLFHDIGKAVTLKGEDQYVEQDGKWKNEKGILYEFNPEIRDGLTHAQRSIRLLSHHGVQMTDEEYLAILSHDFLYVDENICFKNKMNKLGLFLHWSDVKANSLDRK